MYITTYAADAQPSLDMRRLWQHHDNSSLMSKCKHHLMDSSAKRKQSSLSMLENDISLVSRLNVTAKVVEEEKKHHTTFVWFCWWDDQIWQCLCWGTWDSVCYGGAFPCYHHASSCRKWHEGGSWQWVRITQNHPVFQKTKAMTPWFKPFKKIMSALWNLSLCRPF